MAKKVKLPLDMGNDVMVRDIDELKENYNAEKVVEYFLSGQLLTWLNDRYYDTEAEAVERLAGEENREGLPAKLAAIFGVTLESEVDAEEVAYRSERLDRLRQYTSDDEILASVDAVAFDQADLGDILDEGGDVIYLCGERFRIPCMVKNKKYIGINNPTVSISGNKPKFSADKSGAVILTERNIEISNCSFDDPRLNMVNNIEKTVEQGLAYLEREEYEKSLECFKTAAEAGSHEGEFQLGKTYDLGRGVEEDPELATKWYQKAAEDGSAKAYNNLGKIYAKDEDYVKALEMYKKGLEIEERPILLYNLACAYLDSDYGEEKPEEAEKLLLKAAEQGYALACTKLSDFNISKAEYYFGKVSDEADYFDCEKIADKLLDKTMEGNSAEKALKYYELAIKKYKEDEDEPDEDDDTNISFNAKCTICRYRLGQISLDEAVEQITEAVEADTLEQGFLVEELIRIYDEDKHDSDKRAYWCKFYAENGCGLNERYLSIAADTYYREGNIDEAIQWYRLSCGYEHSCDKLGVIYTIEPGYRDFSEARSWFEAELRVLEKKGVDKNSHEYKEVKSKINMTRNK